MIKIEQVDLNGVLFMHTYSDADYIIKQAETGILYSDAIDPIDRTRSYTETSEKIPDLPSEPADPEEGEEDITALETGQIY